MQAVGGVTGHSGIESGVKGTAGILELEEQCF